MQSQEPSVAWSFEAIGTQWWIGVYQVISQAKLRHLKRIVAERIESFDKTYSRFRADSTVTKMASSSGLYVLPDDSKKLFDLYRKLYMLSDGAVTPLIGQVLSDTGYDANYSLKPGKLTAPPKWDDVLSFQAGVVGLNRPALLDFGAAGKGYLVDIIAQLLQDEGISQFCVDAGGDMVCRGHETGLQIGLENPADPTEVIGVIDLANGALCGSAGNRRVWGDYTHIIDPSSLRSPKNIAAVWCKADDALTADGLTTALFFVPAARLQQVFDFEYCVVYADGRIDCSMAFRDVLFIQTEEILA